MIFKSVLFITSTLLPLFFLCGCASMLPLAKSSAESPWESFEQAKGAFDKIKPYTTTTAELASLGFTPYVTPNIKILSYLEVIDRFMPHSSITKDDIDGEILRCIEAKDTCQAYEIKLYKLREERYGNIFLDLFRFKRKSHKSGWNFWAIIVLRNDLVVYTIWGGQPKVNEHFYRKNPLGPLQEPAGLATDAAVISTF